MNSWGERSYFVNPELKLKRGSYFATVKSKDGENDKASYLNRPGVFRLSIGLTPKKYEEIFGRRSLRPLKGGVIAGNEEKHYSFGHHLIGETWGLKL